MRVSFSKEEQLYTEFYSKKNLENASQNNSNGEELKKKHIKLT